VKGFLLAGYLGVASSWRDQGMACPRGAISVSRLRIPKEDTMDVLEAIRTQHAVRRFTNQPISEQDLRAILNAGRRAHSSKNTQPWMFIAVRDRQTLRQLAECGPFARHLADAAAGIALVSPNPTGFDLGQACAYMQLAAWHLGIGSVIGSMYDADRAKQILGIPADQHFDVALSLGYPDPSVPRPAAPRGQGRKPFDEVVRFGHW
jgi:nitroreductase